MLSRVALRAARQPAASSSALVARGSATDTSNEFHRPVRAVEPGKVRLGFVPEEWFQFFHQKTGVTGPYTFGVGLATYLFSKEIYVMEHEFYSGLSLFVMVVYAATKFGPKLAVTLDKQVEEVEKEYNQGREDSVKQLEDAIENEKKLQWSTQGQELLIQAKKENVLIQLEAAYRERMMKAYNEVKHRLDYQLDKATVERRIAQKNMVDWIVKGVNKAITPDQEKQTLDRCISDLAALAVRK